MRPEASYVLGPESCLFVGLPATQGEACGRLCWGCRNAAWLCSIPEVIGGQLLVHIAVTPLPEQALLQVAGSLHTQIGAFQFPGENYHDRWKVLVIHQQQASSVKPFR